jgi:hypothetical protein
MKISGISPMEPRKEEGDTELEGTGDIERTRWTDERRYDRQRQKKAKKG